MCCISPQLVSDLYPETINIPSIFITGSGKTIPGLLCSQKLDKGKSTVWILPLRSLHEQYHFRCKQYNISCAGWSPEMSALHAPSAIIVAIDSTHWEVFQDFIRKLHANGRLARIIVDEAHLALEHESFRPVMHQLKWMGSSGMQIILQTATLPPTQEQQLLDIFGITMCHISRTETPRPNISYNVIRAASANLDIAVGEEYKKAIEYSENNRVLIFCRSKSDARNTARLLDIPHCDADMSQ